MGEYDKQILSTVNEAYSDLIPFFSDEQIIALASFVRHMVETIDLEQQDYRVIEGDEVGLGNGF